MKSIGRGSFWGAVGLALGLMLAPGMPAYAAGEPPPPVSDYALMVAEFQGAGGLKFFEVTEDLLRLAQFDRALMRYRFLMGQIEGKSDYYPMTVQIKRRLQFLQAQLRLDDRAISAIPARKLPRPKQPAPSAQEQPSPQPEPTKPQKKSPEDTESPGQDEPGSQVPTPPGVAPQAAAAPGPPSSPPTPEPAPEKKAPVKPKPPPSLWQKIKNLWPWGKKG